MRKFKKLVFVSIVLTAVVTIEGCQTFKKRPSKTTPKETEEETTTAVPAKPKLGCGQTGDLASRIKECNQSQTVDEFTWNLVTKTEDGYQIWRDRKSQMIWSDRADDKMNYDKAIDYCFSPGRGRGPKGDLMIKYWLPTKTEFLEGISHGLLKVLPKVQKKDRYWIAPKWTYGLEKSAHQRNPLSILLKRDKIEAKPFRSLLAVRCVGIMDTEWK